MNPIVDDAAAAAAAAAAATATAPVTQGMLNDALARMNEFNERRLDEIRQFLVATLAPRPGPPPDVAAASTSYSSPLPLVNLPKSLRLPPLPHLDGKNIKQIRPWFEQCLGHLLAAGVDPASTTAVFFAAAHFTPPLSAWWHQQKALAGGDRTAGLQTFEELVSAIFTAHRLRNPADEARRRISRLRQTSSVASYTSAFRMCLVDLPDRSEADNIYCYKEGLKPSVKQMVAMTPNLTTLSAVIQQALEADHIVMDLGLRFNHHSSSSSLPPNRSSRTASVPMDLGHVACWADDAEAQSADEGSASAADDDDIVSQAQLAAVAARASLPSCIPSSSRRPPSSSANRRPPPSSIHRHFSPPSANTTTSKSVNCYVCGEGHSARDCPKRHPASKMGK